MGKKTIWLRVTADDIELPLAVADSAAELARMCGCSQNNIYSTISQKNLGKIKHGQFKRVEIEEDEE